MTIIAPIETRDVHSRRLIAHAEIELANGDRLQASEKAWGAVAHRLKSIADRRGWEYATHRQAYRVARLLADEMGNPQILVLFYAANGLHQNYCVDAQPIESLREQIDMVKDLLDLLDRVE